MVRYKFNFICPLIFNAPLYAAVIYDFEILRFWDLLKNRFFQIPKSHNQQLQMIFTIPGFKI